MGFFSKRVRCKRFYQAESRTINLTGLDIGIPSAFNFGVGSFKIDTKFVKANDELLRLDLLQYSNCTEINAIDNKELRDTLLVENIRARRKMMEIASGIQSGTYSEIADIDKKTDEILRLLKERLPTITKSDLANIEFVDSLVHPNKWRKLNTVGYALRLEDVNDNTLQAILEGFIQFIAYSAITAFRTNYQNFILNIIHEENAESNKCQFSFLSNNGGIIHELSELFSTKDKLQLREKVSLGLKEFTLSKKFTFFPMGGASIEVSYDPETKNIAFANAPIYEGEDTKNEKILTNLLLIDRTTAEHIQLSLGKAMAFIGRSALCSAYFVNRDGRLITNFDIPEHFNYQPNLLRLIYYIIDKGKVEYDLFRVSVDNPETWDYAYKI